MNESNKLLDKFAATCITPTDAAIAASLRVSKQAVSGWRNGRAHPNADAVERMCSAIGEPLRAWLPLIEAERARTPADKRVWLRLAQTTAAVALILSFGHLNGQTGALAAMIPAACNSGTLYIMSNIAIVAFGTAVACWIKNHRNRQWHDAATA